MKNFVLTKGEKEDSKTVNLKKLIVANLCIIDDEHSFINEVKLYSMICKYGYVPNDYGSIRIKKEPIIIKKPTFSEHPKYVREFITGVKIPYAKIVYIGSGGIPTIFDSDSQYTIDTKNKEFDIFVCNEHNLSPSVEELWKYIEKHEDAKEYADSLLEKISEIQTRTENMKEKQQKNKLLIKIR